jgi:hypothetical protein
MGVIGIDHAWAYKTAGLMRIGWTPAIFKKLLILEAAAMKRLNQPETGK